jgi:hypothetical protein
MEKNLKQNSREAYFVSEARSLISKAEKMRMLPGSGNSISKVYESAAQSYIQARRFLDAANCYLDAQIYGDIHNKDQQKQFKDKEKEMRSMYKINLRNKKESSGLERRIFSKRENSLLAMVVVASLSISLFFISSNLTGFAVSNLSYQGAQGIGMGFFLVGLVFAFFYLRNREKISKDL